ncbi:toll/interleukin-1 receptor domain-containing protein [Streptomyces sp. NPDC047046]|uniref:toll/interleukin-1 receptor domain-containing protein n=1 Tax=Streptomyces sp. NPDC047046 TaxID=3155378 RepID=UPI0033D3E40D
MPEIFINYRTGDGESAAAHLRDKLVERFGNRHVFYASRSIELGDDYEEKLEKALRQCSVLIAVIGPRWTTFGKKLASREDWVRLEIERALHWGTPVIPVLLGRHMPRISAADLPEELAPLADLQSAVFDTHDVEGGVRRIGDAVAALVPGLEVEPDSPAPEPGAVANKTGDVGGNAVQARDVSGGLDFGTRMGEVNGQVHTGSGDLLHNPRFHHGDRHFHGDGATYVEGDQRGETRHYYGERRRDAEEGR